MELRKDYILDKWVIFSDKRKNRPFNFVKEKKQATKDCVFCAGNENKTPKTIYEVIENGKWKIRVIPNLFPAADPNGNPVISTHNKFYTFSSNYGKHEVIIETTEHGKGFASLSQEDIKKNIKVYNMRINELLKDKNIKYVCFYKNQGADAGASIDHAHSQIIAVSILPQAIAEKIAAIKKYESCPYCDIIASEKDSHRRVNENDSFVAFCPYASRFNYEVWILPKKHMRSMNDFSEKEYDDLADIYKKALGKLEEKNIDYDVDWFYSPENEDMHFHVEIKPRIQKWAGFEIGYGIIINEITPEDAAKFYRGEQ
jgi:UDPglucose--hexose-1-phosphate uridylyltransferase